MEAARPPGAGGFRGRLLGVGDVRHLDGVIGRELAGQRSSRSVFLSRLQPVNRSVPGKLWALVQASWVPCRKAGAGPCSSC